MGIRTSVTSSLGADIVLETDVTGLPQVLKAGSFETRMQYNRHEQLTAKEWNNGLKETFAYDKMGRLAVQQVVQGHRSPHRRSYEWQPGNRLTVITDNNFGQKSSGMMPWAI